jgi:hypothetical protein
MSRYKLDPDYHLPIFADGTVRFHIKEGDKTAFVISHGVRGSTGTEQRADLDKAVEEISAFVELANKGAAL